MIGKIKGVIDQIFFDHLIVNNNEIGYLIFCPKKLLNNLTSGTIIELFIYTHVREDHIHLYGFQDISEKNAFILLQSIKGVGSKMALNIISYLSIKEIEISLINKDRSIFSTIPGIGNKLAERIIVELKDKFSTCITTSSLNTKEKTHNNDNFMIIDAVSALVNLGINRIDAHNRVINIFNNNKNISLDEIIKLSLKKPN